jgi:hypothetical protein
MSYRLFLDDVREPYEVGNYMYPVDLRREYRLYDWVIVRSYDQFVQYINENGMPTHISFDHDLADIHYVSDDDNVDEKNGYHCALWLVDYIIDNGVQEFPIVYVHSMNPIGKERIQSLLFNFKLKFI